MPDRTLPPTRAPRDLDRRAGLAAAIAAGLCLAACGRSEPADGPRFAIAMAPLSLPGVTNACYRLTVTNGPDRSGDIVWQEDRVCADQFGDGRAAIAYVGSCDADVAGENSVTLELLDLMTGAPTPSPLDAATYRNPCGAVADWASPSGRDALASGEDPYGPCTINKRCVENADVPVRFDITVMRDANQGFFDVAVEFDDIFCSAKLDCLPALLHDASGTRAPTVNVAFACTAGVNEQTYMQLSDLVLSCDAPGGLPPLAPMLIPAAGATPGQHGPIAPGIFQWAAYRGDEQLTSNGQPLEKCYWNRAIGLDLAALAGRTCSLSGLATASAEPLTLATLAGDGVSYPVIRWSVPVVTADGSLCGPNPLDGDGSGVTTAYVDAATDPRVIAALTGGATLACGAPTPLACAAGPLVDGAPLPVSVALDGASLTVQTGSSSTTLELPGYTLDGCHLDDCCTQ